MARVFETLTVEIDFSPSFAITNIPLPKNFSVLEVAVLTNIITSNAHRIVTFGIVYDDAVVSQHSLSVKPILVGNNIADVTDVALTDIETVQFTEFIDSTIRGDEFLFAICTFSTVGAQVNQYSTIKVQLDPANPITVGLPILDTGSAFLESHMVNVGSLQHTTQEPARGQGTLNAIETTVSQA